VCISGRVCARSDMALFVYCFPQQQYFPLLQYEIATTAERLSPTSYKRKLGAPAGDDRPPPASLPATPTCIFGKDFLFDEPTHLRATFSCIHIGDAGDPVLCILFIILKKGNMGQGNM
jgi:hypothetical protein